MTESRSISVVESAISIYANSALVFVNIRKEMRDLSTKG